jgi:hypothetical protein
MHIKREKTVCKWEGIAPQNPLAGSKLGLAVTTLGKMPINGLRLKEENGTNGWYIWCGSEMSKADDFFSPLHIEHVESYLPQIKGYLELPPGYRFLIDNNNYEDVWFDPDLINI